LQPQLYADLAQRTRSDRRDSVRARSGALEGVTPSAVENAGGHACARNRVSSLDPVPDPGDPSTNREARRARTREAAATASPERLAELRSRYLPTPARGSASGRSGAAANRSTFRVRSTLQLSPRSPAKHWTNILRHGRATQSSAPRTASVAAPRSLSPVPSFLSRPAITGSESETATESTTCRRTKPSEATPSGIASSKPIGSLKQSESE
jgi:hypothetical protein